jgi:hypothetical protein
MLAAASAAAVSLVTSHQDMKYNHAGRCICCSCVAGYPDGVCPVLQVKLRPCCLILKCAMPAAACICCSCVAGHRGGDCTVLCYTESELRKWNLCCLFEFGLCHAGRCLHLLQLCRWSQIWRLFRCMILRFGASKWDPCCLFEFEDAPCWPLHASAAAVSLVTEVAAARAHNIQT